MSVPDQLSLSATVVSPKIGASNDMRLVTLKNDKITITLTNLGCTIISIFTPDRSGERKNIVAGFARLNEYQQNDHYFGCIVGRYANRIANGSFSIDDTNYHLSLNDGSNHLHGGFAGFHKKVWDISSVIENESGTGVVFEYFSKDGEEGYPGNLTVRVKYVLNDKNQLSIEYRATTDQATPVNLTNHSYFNLTGFENDSILDHELLINAGYYTPKNENNIPDGSIDSVEGTALDFSVAKKIGSGIDQLVVDKGYDHNYVLDKSYADEMVLAAALSEPVTGRTLRVFTDKPGMQLYTGNLWDGSVIGSQGVAYKMHGGLALETQYFADSPNKPNFPNTILHPGVVYESTTLYEFGVQ